MVGKTNHWLKSIRDEIAAYGVEDVGDVVAEMMEDQKPNHSFRVGDHVRSHLSGRTGIVKDFTRAIVLVEFDDIHSNVDYAKAPEAWVPHGVLEKIDSEPKWLAVVRQCREALRASAGPYEIRNAMVAADDMIADYEAGRT
jgi:hypothetical protein